MNAPTLRHLPASWRQALPIVLLLLAAVLVAYRDTAAAMVTIWSRSDTFAHAYLVLPITLWLIWRQREALASMQPQPCLWMLLPMALVAFAWLLGDLAAVNSITQFALMALLVLTVPAVLGLGVARTIMFPLGFLFFAVPVGEFLLPQLMAWTADFTVLALRASGIPVFREGMNFVIPSGNWSVVEACSGVRYLIASFMVGTLFAHLNYRSARRRWIFVGISIAVPIVANWVRAYLIVMIGHLSDNRFAVGADHLIYGWVFFGVVIGLMYAIGAWWSESEAPSPPAATVANAPARRRSASAFVAAGAVTAILALAPHVALRAIGAVPMAALPVLAGFNELPGVWQASDQAVAAWKPAFQNPTSELQATYTADGRHVGLYIGYYRQQDYRRKLVSSENELVKSNDPIWASIGGSQTEALPIDGAALTVRSTSLRGRTAQGSLEQRLRVWQLYWVGDRLTASDHWAKVYAAGDRLLGRGDDAALIVLYADEVTPGAARATLEAFARAELGVIVEQLRKARDGTQASIAAGQSSNLIRER